MAVFSTGMRDLRSIQAIADRIAAPRRNWGSSSNEGNQSNQVQDSQNQANQTGSGALGAVTQGNASVSRANRAAAAGGQADAGLLFRGAGVPGESFSNVSIDMYDLETPNNMMQ